ncbi:MAG: hypothetical protein ACM3P1_07065, partial [Candidatus Saccharibacteria bacterium]
IYQIIICILVLWFGLEKLACPFRGQAFFLRRGRIKVSSFKFQVSRPPPKAAIKEFEDFKVLKAGE